MTDPEDKAETTASASTEKKEVLEILEECGVEEFDNRVVGMLMDTQFALTSKLLEMAFGLSRHNGKAVIDAEDVQAAADILGVLKNSTPSREKILQLAADKNNQPLPQIRHNYGLKLPNDRFCQLQPNLEYKTDSYEPMDTSMPNQRIMEQPMSMLHPDQVQNILKRRAPDDDFDS